MATALPWLRAAILRAGGFDKVSELSGYKAKTLYNYANGDRRLTRDAINALRPHLDVSDLQWWGDLTTVCTVQKDDKIEASA